MSLLLSLSRYPIDWTIRVIALCLLVQISMSTNLWQCQDRFFFQLPLISTWPLDFLCAVDQWLYYSLFISLLALLWKPTSKLLLASFLLLLGLLLLQDLNRLQVWLFQLAGMLFIALAYHRDRPEVTLLQWQCVLLSVYFWGALQKFNVYFIRDTVPWLVEDWGMAEWFEHSPFLGYGLALIELLMVLGLWLPRTRSWAFALVSLFHLLLLFLLGPLGKNWNPIVWPWNLVQIILVFLLFFNQKTPIRFSALKSQINNQLLALAMTTLLVIGPLMSFFGDWPEPLSFKMYAGTNPEAVLYWEEKTPVCLPNTIEDLIIDLSSSTHPEKRYLLVDKWALRELGVPPFVSQYRLKQFGAKFCECLEYPDIGGMDILLVNRWQLDQEQMVHYSCKELLKSN